MGGWKQNNHLLLQEKKKEIECKCPSPPPPTLKSNIKTNLISLWFFSEKEKKKVCLSQTKASLIHSALSSDGRGQWGVLHVEMGWGGGLRVPY